MSILRDFENDLRLCTIPMFNRGIESHLGVLAVGRQTANESKLLVARLPAEDAQKRKREIVFGCNHVYFQTLVPNMLCGASGRVKQAEAPVDAMWREIREELSGLPIHFFELVPLDTMPPLMVLQSRNDQVVLFCCLAFNCFISPKGVEYLAVQPELQTRQLRFRTKEDIIRSKQPLRPLLAATLEQVKVQGRL